MLAERLPTRQKRWLVAGAVPVISGGPIIDALLAGRLPALEHLLTAGVVTISFMIYLCWPSISADNRAAGVTLLVAGLGIVWVSKTGLGTRPGRNALGGVLLVLYGVMLLVRPGLFERIISSES
ncbi:hypothetical protein C480_09260 [Natrialba aegyptia DSM 13077]|uniref:Uncharacterized protein n=1 Tax=Natrialba aegyptia DSM 13077 TaxID=1227491 RepID=M0B6U0_9EURY|nr:hypothetical protein C480_09260 [Natrialba aegyptia DSM 13077]